MCSNNRNDNFGSFKPLKRIVKPGPVIEKETYRSKNGDKLTTITVKGTGKIKFSR